MTQLLENAIRSVKQLPDTEQDEVAHMVLEYIDADAKWDRLFTDPKSELVLAELLAKAEQEIAEGHVYECDPNSKSRGP